MKAWRGFGVVVIMAAMTIALAYFKFEALVFVSVVLTGLVAIEAAEG
jgi:hypothetical protein